LFQRNLLRRFSHQFPGSNIDIVPQFHQMILEEIPTDVVIHICEQISDLNTLGRMMQVCKSFYYLIGKLDFLYRRFLAKEVWYKCASSKEKRQYQFNYKMALSESVQLKFTSSITTNYFMLTVHRNMSIATLHLIICAFLFIPPYRTQLSLQIYDSRHFFKRQKIIAARIFDRNLMEYLNLKSTKLIRVHPIML